jgi:glycosyltransferase involved in cell wall biosynthesis
VALTAAASAVLEGAFTRHGASGLPAAAVCTRGRPERLARTLESLERQSLPLGEILVIDNAGPGEPNAKDVTARFCRARWISEPRPGLDVARNTALDRARSEVVLFLDDDAVAEADWALHLVRAFEASSVAACTGRVEALDVEAAGAALFEANGGYGRGDERIVLPRDAKRRLHGLPAPLIAWAVSIGSGCSLAVRRRAALAIGGFDEALDRGPSLPGGGDHDLLWRLLGAGHSVAYEPASVARHEHRATERDAIVQIAGHQRGLIAFLMKSLVQAETGRAPIAAFLTWRLMKPGARLVRRAAGRDVLPARALLAVWADALRGLRAYPTARTYERGGFVEREGARAAGV